MIRKIYLYIAIMLASMIASSTLVAASTTPVFPSCDQPSGSIIAQYDSGMHGIAGDSSTYHGSDAVYQLSNSQVLQCFCPEEGSEGIQSNWWKYSELSEDEIKILIKAGWIAIPSGAVWGLNDAPYLVQNHSYSCRGTGGGSSSENGSQSDSNDSPTGSGGQVLGVSSLAATGNALAILTFVSMGSLALISARRK